MGQKDISEKVLADHNDVFADIVNVLLFDGENLLKEDELTNTKDKSQYKADGKLHEQERDLTKKWQRHNVVLSLFGMENQTDEDGDMPMRIIGYDGASYRAQCLSGQKERYPIITIVLHFGTKHRWKEPQQLSEIFAVSEELKPYFHDYGINVFDIAYLSEEQINMFRSDFRIVADYLRQKRVKGDYIPDMAVVKHVDEVMKLLDVLTGSNDFIEAGNDLKKGGGTVTMCEVIDKIKKDGRDEGRREGKIEGKKEGKIELLTKFVRNGMLSVSEAAKEVGMDMASFELEMKKCQ